MLSRTRWARESSMFTIGLNSTNRSRNSRTAKLIRGQSRPCQFKPRVLAIASIRRSARPGCPSHLPDEDERDDQRVDGDGFGKAETNQQRHQDRADDLRIAADGLHGLANAVTDADARADRPKTDGQGRRPHTSAASGCCRLGKETELKHARTSTGF